VPTVTYVPQSADDPSTVQWGGMTLKAGEAVETNDRRLLTKADGNKYFKVSASDEEMGEAEREVVGGYYDTNSGQEVSLVRVPRTPTYATSLPPEQTVPPSSATQGSTALEALRTPSTTGGNEAEFERIYGVKPSELATGDYEGAAEPGEPVIGTESDRKVENKSQEFKPGGDTKPVGKAAQAKQKPEPKPSGPKPPEPGRSPPPPPGGRK
jgi:hypothetical protein